MPSRLRLTAAGLTTGAVLLGLTGCTGLDQASAAGISRDDMVSEMAVQLARVTGLTYTATYQLAGGDTATVTQAQKPTRTAYDFPGGRLVEETAGTVRCSAKRECTRTAPQPATALPLPGSTLVTPEAALALLNAATLDQDVEVTPHDTTIAGRHATCLDLTRVDGTPTSEFGICVTNEGALGSFAATIAGTRYEQAMTAYKEKAAPEAFEAQTLR
ncbi:hypothetical protein GCM10010172_13100 [Paractinoplanes ferrugineus]|uniref:Lipoprotein n=1 Tax=Paractinoplanes ferrugineus TaxID=113564 RepID=A0A919IWR4_9ACTN|nr:hypothetical protein [Actinoplanes ferrugineus]GIE09875.1 hypothetical protein Afe05nite_17150 [Actinoplanes ferrugineus]